MEPDQFNYLFHNLLPSILSLTAASRVLLLLLMGDDEDEDDDDFPLPFPRCFSLRSCRPWTPPRYSTASLSSLSVLLMVVFDDDKTVVV